VGLHGSRADRQQVPSLSVLAALLMAVKPVADGQTAEPASISMEVTCRFIVCADRIGGEP
jgi:hypothetical protein